MTTPDTAFVGLRKDGEAVILMPAHVAAVLPSTNEVLMSCGLVYQLSPSSMDGMLRIWFSVKRAEVTPKPIP